MEELAVHVILGTGWPLDYVLGLDVLTFNALVTLMTRIEYRKMAERTWAHATAASAGFTGDTKNLKHLTEMWTNPDADRTTRKPDAAGIALLSKLAGRR